MRGVVDERKLYLCNPAIGIVHSGPGGNGGPRLELLTVAVLDHNRNAGQFLVLGAYRHASNTPEIVRYFVGLSYREPVFKVRVAAAYNSGSHLDSLRIDL